MALEKLRIPQQQQTNPQRRNPDQQNRQETGPPGRGPAHSDLATRPSPPTD